MRDENGDNEENATTERRRRDRRRQRKREREQEQLEDTAGCLLDGCCIAGCFFELLVWLAVAAVGAATARALRAGGVPTRRR